MKIEYTQFTRWDSEHHPEIDNNEYLDYKEVNTGLSRGICSYGYCRCYDVGNGVIKYEWIKREEALKELEKQEARDE